MAETRFEVKYDGAALESGRMPVRDLAPALLALGDLFTTASGTLYPHLDPVAVQVEATAEGSFVVKLLIDAGDAWGHVVDLFTTDDVDALSHLADAVFAGTGLIGLIKWVGRRRVKAVDPTPDPGTVRLTLDDLATIEVRTETWSLYRNVEIRKHTRGVVQPLARDGVESVTFTTPKHDSVEVDESELDAFVRLDDASEDLLQDTTQELFLEVVAVAFIQGNKWRLGIGDHNFWASIEDEHFLAQVESGEQAFRKGDILKCRVAIEQTRDVEGLHTTYRVLEVLDHLPRGQLDFG